MSHRGALWRKVVGSLLILGVTGGALILDSNREVAAAGSLTVGGEIVYSTAVFPHKAGQTYQAYQAYGVRKVGSPGSPLPLPLNITDLAGISLDGKQVAVALPAAEDGSVLGSLQVSTTNGSHKHTIWKFLGTPDGSPAWNPAGTEIAITVMPQSSRGGGLNLPGSILGGLWVVPVKGGRAHLIAPAAFGSVAWSPNGKTLVYTTGQTNSQTPVTIRTISARGGPYRKLAAIPPEPYADVFSSVAWSPKGNSILIDWYQQFSRGSSLGHSEVQQVPSGGGRLETLLPINPTADYTGATYSPDGKRIAVITAVATSPVTTTTLPSVPVSVTLNTLSVNGSDLQTAASLPSGAQMIGWLNTLK